MSGFSTAEDQDARIEARLDAVAEGDERAIADLVSECWPTLTRFAATKGATEPDAVANIVLNEFVTRAATLRFDSAGHMWAYLYRIARSRIADEHRRRPAPEPVENAAIDGPDLVEFEGVVVERMWMDQLLMRLTEGQREVLELRFLHDLSIEETAKRTGRTMTSVKAIQRRALRAAVTAFTVLVLIALAIRFLDLGSAGFDLRPTSPATTSTTTTPAAVEATAETPPAPITAAAPTTTRDLLVVYTGVDAEARIPLPFELGDRALVFRNRTRVIDTTPETDGTWEVVDGPGPVAITDESGRHDAIFSVPGSYTLRFTTELDGRRISDELTVEAVYATLSCNGLDGSITELTGLGFDVVVGTPGDDVIDVSDGDRPDYVLGLGGDDVITTGDGNDVVCGGEGNDWIRTNEGSDTISGGPGDDELRGNPGADMLSGGPGDDLLVGGFDDDVLRGDAGDDELRGSRGDDTLLGGDGDDSMTDGHVLDP
ncbi:MAG: sigma-70 family RNA polymerase sigma factor [Actinomycetota bacterium]